MYDTVSHVTSVCSAHRNLKPVRRRCTRGDTDAGPAPSSAQGSASGGSICASAAAAAPSLLLVAGGQSAHTSASHTGRPPCTTAAALRLSWRLAMSCLLLRVTRPALKLWQGVQEAAEALLRANQGESGLEPAQAQQVISRLILSISMCSALQCQDAHMWCMHHDPCAERIIMTQLLRIS